MPKHSPGRRATISFSPEAEQQIRALEPAELEWVDQALVTISIDPMVGAPMASAPVLREFHKDGARVIYFASVLGHVVVVAYVEG